MNTISDRDRARALEMWRAATRADGVSEYKLPNTINEGHARYWLAAEAHVLAAHECPTVPVWRPTTAEEIQPGWEVRVRYSNGSEATWGVAHHRDGDGDWATGMEASLTFANLGWTYETTAPLPEPWPDELVEALYPHVISDASEVLDIIAAKFPGVRAAITGGEQS